MRSNQLRTGPTWSSHVGVLGSSVPGTSLPAGQKGVRLSKQKARLQDTGDRTATLAMPIKTLSQFAWETWGGVSERPSGFIEESDLLALTLARYGGRRPGLPDDGSLRGVPFERRSWSVRPVCRVPPCGPTHRRQRMSEGLPRRGTSSALRSACVGTRRKGASRHLRSGDASFTRSFDSCSSILTELRGRKLSEVRRAGQHRGRANLRKQEEPAPGLVRTGVARLASCPRSCIRSLV
jgi:hypothetical protein